MPSILALVCVLTFVHYTGAQMRGPVLPLYATAHGATPTGVGLIVGTHMAVAAVASIPLGRAADIWGRRPFLLAGMVISAATSLLLPLVQTESALLAVYGLAGLGVAAFTPSALAIVGDTSAAGRAGRAFAWYSTAHYGAIAIGPFLGGLAAERWGYRPAFVAAAQVVAVALALGLAVPATPVTGTRRPGAGLADVRRDTSVWAGWVAAASGMGLQGVVFTFFPLFAVERGLGPGAIGLVFLVLGVANTLARVPAGWLIDRTGRVAPYAVAGLVVAALATAALPRADGHGAILGLAAVFGGASGIAFVGISAALAASSTAATRGVVMGGYSTALYLGLALGSFALGPIITRAGHGVGFTSGGVAAAVGILLAAALWTGSARPADAREG